MTASGDHSPRLPKAVVVLLWLVAAAAVVFLLFTVVFPWVDRTLLSDPTLEAAGRQFVT